TILLDDKYATDYPWAWPGNAEESRGSYLEDKDWGSLLEAFVLHLGNPDAAIDLISGKAIAQDEKALASTGDPGKFFVLSGDVDPTLAIPNAVFDLIGNLGNYLDDGLPYMLYLAREHNVNLLAKLEGDWRYSGLAGNANVVQLDYVSMGGHRADGSVIPNGGMAAAVIADNTLPRATGTAATAQPQANGNGDVAGTAAAP
ncbi:hypothetical protein, partial [Streptomyces sp. NPDC093223]|uniref:hypothetical protein n=1 Tax=Streptomyces sp. NPDC093223 TaxID=3366033 RepID=UPI0037F93C51